MITIASGRCTSEPIPWDRVMGNNPSMVNRNSPAQPDNGSVRAPPEREVGLGPPLVKVTHHDHSIQDRLPEQRDEADGGSKT